MVFSSASEHYPISSVASQPFGIMPGKSIKHRGGNFQKALGPLLILRTGTSKRYGDFFGNKLARLAESPLLIGPLMSSQGRLNGNRKSSV